MRRARKCACRRRARVRRIARGFGGFQAISPLLSGGICGRRAYERFTVLDYAVVNVGMFYIRAIVRLSFTAPARQRNSSLPVRFRADI